MGDAVEIQDGLYHAGELAVQRRAGGSEDAARLGRGIGRALSFPTRSFLAGQQMVVAASADASGNVWASLLAGPPGFLQAVDDELLFIHGPSPLPEVLVQSLSR